MRAPVQVQQLPELRAGGIWTIWHAAGHAPAGQAGHLRQVRTPGVSGEASAAVQTAHPRNAENHLARLASSALTPLPKLVSSA